MVKKFQVFMPKWLSDHIKVLADKSGVSFSEAIRVYLCLGIICIVDALYTDYKPDISIKGICEEIKDFSRETDRALVKERLSQVYFEARKAVQFRIKKEV